MRHPNTLNRVNRLTRDAGEAWALDATALAVRAAIRDPSAWGETLGPDLLAGNGAFEAGSGWSVDAAVSVSGGVVAWTAAPDARAVFRSAVVTIGRVYRVTYDVVSISGGGVRVGLRGTFGATRTAIGSYSETVTAGSGGSDGLLSVGTTTATVDNLVIREVFPGWLLPGTARLRLSGDSRASVTMARQEDGTFAWEPHNLLRDSEALEAASWTKSNTAVSVSAGVAPNGQNAARLLYPTSSGSARTVFQRVTTGVASSTSLYLKAAGLSWVCMVGAAGSTGTGVWFQIASGVVGTQSAGHTGSIASVGNGWFRITVSHPAVVDPYIELRLVDADGGNTVTANGTDGVLVWGGQLNFGPTATAYVPTTAAARFAPGVEHEGGLWRGQTHPQRTNLALWTADMSNAAWLTFGAGATKVGAATALGALPMYRINVGSNGQASAGASSSVYTTVSLVGSTTYTLFAIVRSVSGDSAFRLACNDGTVYQATAGTATTTPQVFRLEFTTGGSPFSAFPMFAAAAAGGAVGDIEVGGIVLCTGSVPASAYIPIPTWGSTSTRTADDAQALLAAGFRDGTIVVDYTPVENLLGNLAALDNGVTYAAPHGLLIRRRDESTHDTGGASSSTVPGSPTAPGVRTRVAVGFGAAQPEFAISVNGGAVVTLATSDYTGVGTSRLRIGNGPNGPLRAGWHRIRLLDRRLPNGRLQGLSA